MKWSPPKGSLFAVGDWDDEMTVGSGKTKRTNDPKSYCWETHQPVEILEGVFHGGNCFKGVQNVVADIYVALDYGGHPPPWTEKMNRSMMPQSVLFDIPNFGVPHSAKAFHGLIDMLVSALEDGCVVHVGCMGGHGRTGMVLAAILAKAGDPTPIATARARYCKKAVETDAQVEWLHRHFGCEKDAAPRMGFR